MDAFTEVPMPKIEGRGRHAAVCAALVKTARTGMALRITLNESLTFNLLQNALRLHIGRYMRGWRAHVRKDGTDAAIAWLERKPEPAEPSGTGGT